MHKKIPNNNYIKIFKTTRNGIRIFTTKKSFNFFKLQRHENFQTYKDTTIFMIT